MVGLFAGALLPAQTLQELERQGPFGDWVIRYGCEQAMGCALRRVDPARAKPAPEAIFSSGTLWGLCRKPHWCGSRCSPHPTQDSDAIAQARVGCQ
jgi:hypothetical protein